MLLKGIEINRQTHLLLHLPIKEPKTTLVVLLFQLKWDNMVAIQVQAKEEFKEITHTVKEVAMGAVHQHLWGKVMVQIWGTTWEALWVANQV